MTSMKYRPKNPVEVDVIFYEPDGSNTDDVLRFMFDHNIHIETISRNTLNDAVFNTKTAVTFYGKTWSLAPGWWLIKWPLDSVIGLPLPWFTQSYEPVND